MQVKGKVIFVTSPAESDAGASVAKFFDANSSTSEVQVSPFVML